MIRKQIAILCASAMVLSLVGCGKAASSSSSSSAAAVSSVEPASISAPTLTSSEKEELLNPVVEDQSPIITDMAVGKIAGGGMSSVNITANGKDHSFGKSDYIYVGAQTTMDEEERVCVLSDANGYAVVIYAVDESVADIEPGTQKIASVTGSVSGAAMHSFELVQEGGASVTISYNNDVQLPAEAINLPDGLTENANVTVYYTGGLDGKYSVVYIGAAKK